MKITYLSLLLVLILSDAVNSQDLNPGPPIDDEWRNIVVKSGKILSLDGPGKPTGKFSFDTVYHFTILMDNTNWRTVNYWFVCKEHYDKLKEGMKVEVLYYSPGPWHNWKDKIICVRTVKDE